MPKRKYEYKKSNIKIPFKIHDSDFECQIGKIAKIAKITKITRFDTSQRWPFLTNKMQGYNGL